MALRGVRLMIVVLASGACAPAQQIISAKSGFVYYVQGRASVEGSGPLPFGTVKRQLTNGETLFTERGRAEVLLNPGTVLRLGNASRLRMDDITITNPCVSMLSGSAVITVNYLPKPDRVELHLGGSIVVLAHVGEYRLDAGTDAARLRVYRGRAEVRHVQAEGDAASSLRVKQGTAVDLGNLVLAKFDTKDADDFERWAEARSRRGAPRSPQPVPPRYSAESRVPAGFR
jgi:hypothetical protein